MVPFSLFTVSPFSKITGVLESSIQAKPSPQYNPLMKLILPFSSVKTFPGAP